MAGRVLRGAAASPGLAVGPVRRLDGGPSAASERRAGPAEPEIARAREALQQAAADLEATAQRLRDEGHADEAEIVEAGALMARDPALERAVHEAVDAAGLTAASAILTATSAHADLIAALGDETLAARADDVRSLGRRAAAHATQGSDPLVAVQPTGLTPVLQAHVLVAEDLGPADVAELEGVVAIALARGGATAHAAIVARSLGVPMVVGLGDAVLELSEDTMLLVDGGDGALLAGPEPAETERAREAMEEAARRRARAARNRALPAVTLDGRNVGVLGNAAGGPEVRAALAAGADGIGLLRTELAFLDAPRWPTEAEHRRLLDDVVAALGGERRPVVVRLLDFGGDKTPPFLRGVPERGIGLLLAHPGALHDQLKAIASVRERTGADLRVLLPLVETPDQLAAVAGGLPRGTPIGAMVETPGAAQAAAALAARSAFLSIGTNDLSHATLGTDRFASGQAVAHHPRVLAEIARTAHAAAEARVPLEVCGEAASDPTAMPLLVGLGVDELSVGAARVGVVRDWVRALRHDECRALAAEALQLPDAPAVAELVARRLGRRLDEAGEERGEAVDGDRRVGAVGP